MVHRNLAARVFLIECVRWCRSSAWNPSVTLLFTHSKSQTPDGSLWDRQAGSYLLSGLISHYRHPLLTLSLLPKGFEPHVAFPRPHDMSLPSSRVCSNNIFQVSLPWLFYFKMHPYLSPSLSFFSTPFFSILLVIYLFVFCMVCLLPPTRMKVKGGRDFCSLLCLQHLK